MSRTTVVSLRGKNAQQILYEPRTVYVGRYQIIKTPTGGFTKLNGSIWGNPFKAGTPWSKYVDGKPGELTPEDAVKLYVGHVKADVELVYKLRTLRGNRLACWCVDWDGDGEPERPCHAVILAKLADGEPI